MPSSPESEDEPRGAGDVQVADVEELEQRYAQLEDRYKRALADLDNYRKRARAEVERHTTENREALARDWLEAIDSVERALLMAEPGSALAVGLQAVLEQMEGILERQGVRRIGAQGEPFDPERHEAIAVVPADDVPDRTVVEAARSGYAIGDRVLRPAQVVVSRREEPEH